MNAARHARLATALILLCTSLIATGCKKKDTVVAPGATASTPATAAIAPVDGTGRYCLRREDCPAQWDAFQKKAQDAAHTAELNRLKDLPHGDPNVPDGQYVQLNSGYQLAGLFYALSGMPPDYEALAAAASEEYRTNGDQFRKRDLMQVLRPKMDQQIAAYKDPKHRYFTTDNPSGAVVQHYDFKTSSFPVVLGLGPQIYTYFNDAPNYKLGYNNGNDFLRFNVPDEHRAKDIETMVANHELEYCESVFYLFVQEADPATNEVKAQVVRVVLNDRKHAEFARF